MSQYYITTVPVADENGTPPRLVFDALTEFSPSFSQKLTSYAISDRSVISTHLSKNNTAINISGWVTSCPTAQYENNLITYDDILSRPYKAYELLEQWWNDRVELTVSSEYQIFSPVVITSLNPVNTGSEAVLVNLTLEEARRVSYKRVRLIKSVSPQKELDGKNNTAGSKTKQEQDLPLAERLKNQFRDYSGGGDVAEEIINL